MRVDFTRFGSSGEVRRESVAFDESFVYSLTAGSADDVGMLRVCTRESSEGAGILNYIDLTFLAPIDSLWRYNDLQFADLLQRPDVRLEPAAPESPGRQLIALRSPADGTEATMRFEGRSPYPFVDLVSEATAKGMSATTERYVESIELGDRHLPMRIADIASFGSETGYTQVVRLVLEPLAEKSPLARGLSPDSFLDLGIGYQVYHVTDESLERLGDRYDRPTDLVNARRGGSTRTYLLWVNGALLICAGLALVVRYALRRSKRR